MGGCCSGKKKNIEGYIILKYLWGVWLKMCNGWFVIGFQKLKIQFLQII